LALIAKRVECDMLKRLLLSCVAALAMAASFPTAVSASRPPFLVCVLPDGNVFLILIEGQGSLKDAKRHCREQWHGEPHGVTR
jgi:hypothetical protein